MSAATMLFLIIGCVGVLLLVLGLLGVELLDFNGFGSLEAVAAGLAMFGFAAAVASSSLDARSAPALAAAAGIGVAAAIPSGWLAVRLARAAQRMPTDATPMREDLVGALGVVVTPIPEQGYGEVRVTLGGQPVKLNATAGGAVPLGTQIFVITVPTETSVHVEPIPSAHNDPDSS